MSTPWWEPTLIPNGNIRVPARAKGSGGIVGDAVVELSPDHPDYPVWLERIRERERREAAE